jgi:glyoxylase-like metal-dependent hydrolase (beta-lactamase superfamily II)
MREIAPGVHAVEGLKTGRVYLVEGDANGLALIDTSTSGVAERILSAIESIGRKPEDLRVIVATHYHYDHTGNAAALIERTGAELCVHADDAPYVDGTTPWPAGEGPLAPIADRFGPKQYALKVDRSMRDGDELPFAGGMRVVHAPGHTPGHIALHAPSRRLLFAGDALMNVGGLRLPMAMASHDMTQARASVRRLGDLDYDVLLPGHGAPVVGRASEKVAEWARRWLE